MKPIILPLAFAALGLAGVSSGEEPPNPKVQYQVFAEHAAELQKLRGERLVSEGAFLKLAAEPGTVVLDARSKDKYEQLHVKGATNLPYTDFTAEALAKVIPDKGTRVLIYCNNNFKDEPKAFPGKVQVALNIPTFITLHAYGYTNVHELQPLLEVKNTKLNFAGTATGIPGAKVPNWIVGEMVKTTAEGPVATEAPDEWKQHPIGFPAFRTLTIEKAEGINGWTISGTVCSTNSGMNSQGIPIYSGNERPTRLAGMSDMEGKVQLRISAEHGPDGKAIIPAFVYVGDHPGVPPLRDSTRLRKYKLEPRP